MNKFDYDQWGGKCEERFTDGDGNVVTCHAPIGWQDGDDAHGIATISFRAYMVTDDNIPYSGRIIAICEDCAACR